jgi:DNA-directed RNA polymerase subunit N (RpoN/RPB10)
VKELKGGAEGVEKRTYFDGTTIPETAEAAAMKELDLTRYCCRRILLTHVDLIPKF